MIALLFRPFSRVVKKRDFNEVFAGRARIFAGCLIGYNIVNNLGNPRLGIIVSKKSAKKAVCRNRIKRQVRESFRHVASKLPNMDIVIVARHSASSAKNEDLRQCLDQLWQRLINSQTR